MLKWKVVQVYAADSVYTVPNVASRRARLLLMFHGTNTPRMRSPQWFSHLQSSLSYFLYSMRLGYPVC